MFLSDFFFFCQSTATVLILRYCLMNIAVKAMAFFGILGWTFVWAILATFTNYILGMLLESLRAFDEAYKKGKTKIYKKWSKIYNYFT